MKNSVKYSLAAALLAVTVPCWAQDGVAVNEAAPEGDGDVDPVATRIDNVITVIAAPLPKAQSPVSISVIDAAGLNRTQDVAISDALARLPGVTVTRNGSVGGFTGVRIRGADAAQTLVVIDGVRVQDPSSPGGGFDFGSLLSTGIARIEVLRGSNSLAWGSDAIGGVVLIDTVDGARGRDAQVSGEFGSLNSGRLTARLVGESGTVRYGVGAGLTTTDGISNAAVGSERDGFRQAAGNARVDVAIGDTLHWQTSGLFAASRLRLDGFAPPNFSFGDTDEYQTAQEVYASTRLLHEVGRFRQSLALSFADINRDNFDSALSCDPGFSARGRSERIAYQGDWQALGEPGSNDGLRVIVGADHDYSQAITSDAFSADRRTTAITAGYIQLLGRPTDRLQFGGGYRYDSHRDFGGNGVFSANALWATPVDDLALRFSFAEGFKAPTLFQLSGTASAFGNPALNPERSRSYDAGLRYGSGDGHFSAEISIFRRDSRDLIDFVSCAGTAAPAICGSGNRPFGTYANVDSARAQGVEVNASYRPVDALTLDAAYALIDTEDRSTGAATRGNDLARRPRNTATVTATYGFGDAEWCGGGSVAAELRYIGTSFDDSGNSVPIGDYALVALRWSVTVTPALELYGRVENLFDAHYQAIAGFGSYPRTGTIGVRAKF